MLKLGNRRTLMQTRNLSKKHPNFQHKLEYDRLIKNAAARDNGRNLPI